MFFFFLPAQLAWWREEEKKKHKKSFDVVLKFKIDVRVAAQRLKLVE